MRADLVDRVRAAVQAVVAADGEVPTAVVRRHTTTAMQRAPRLAEALAGGQVGGSEPLTDYAGALFFMLDASALGGADVLP